MINVTLLIVGHFTTLVVIGFQLLYVFWPCSVSFAAVTFLEQTIREHKPLALWTRLNLGLKLDYTS